MYSVTTAAYIILFTFESFHLVGHSLIMFRVRQLPRKDLVRMRLYFFTDLVTVFLSSFVVLQRYQWLAGIQFVQHLYYVLFWEKTTLTKRIVSWSSLDWTRTELYKNWDLQSVLGTSFDILVHFVMSILLGQHLSTVQVIVSFLIGQSWLLYVLTSPRFAWSSPWSTPEWVERRIKPESVQ